MTLGQVSQAEKSLAGREPGCHRCGAREEGVPRNSPLLDEGPMLPGDDTPLSRREVTPWDLFFIGSLATSVRWKESRAKTRIPAGPDSMQREVQERQVEIGATGGRAL